MKCDKDMMLLYAVTDRSWTDDKEGLLIQIESALKGGVTILQLREKNLSDDEFIREAREVQDLCRKYSVPLIINDNVQVALHSGADGVHLGQDDMDIEEARAILGDDKIIGISTHNVEEATLAAKKGADYLGAGAVFTTGTKNDATSLDHEELKRMCESVDIPIVAIGGITKNNVATLAGTGISGVAVVSAIFAAQNIYEETKNLKSMMMNMVRQVEQRGQECTAQFDIEKVKGAIFDMDGTIIDSMLVWDDVCSRYLLSIGIEPEEGLNDIVFTMTLDNGCAYTKEHYGIDKTASEIKDGIISMMRDFYYYEALPFPGAVRVIRELYKKGVPIVLATTGDEDMAVHAFKRLDILKYFDGILSCAMFDTSKHETLIFEKAKSILEKKAGSNLNNQDIYVFEDSLTAVTTTKNMGFTVVGIREAFGQKTWKEIENTADITVDNLWHLYEDDENICPCCEKFYFEKKNSYEICPVCGWENDKIQYHDREYEGGANKLCLNEYRRLHYKLNKP